MKNQKGQSLVEALIALGVATIVVSAMAVAAITAVSNSDFGKYQNLATQYAQQGMEVVRQQSQTDWSKFAATAGTDSANSYCLDQTIPPKFTSLQGCTEINDQNGHAFFLRDVTLLQTGPANQGCRGAIQATVDVSWRDGKCTGANFCHKVTLVSCFADLKAVSR
jgi:hypothetical protein